MNYLIIIGFVALFVLIILTLRYYMNSTTTLSGTQNAQTMTTISAATLPTNGSGVPSANFAYSIWVYVNDWNYKYGQPKVIYGRMGSPSSSSSGSGAGAGVDPCPLVAFDPMENNLSVSMTCYVGSGTDSGTSTSGTSTDASIVNTFKVHDIPLQRWVNVVLSVYNKTLDIYIDGKLVTTNLLSGVVKVNNNADVYVTPNGGFNGWTAKFQYYPEPLNPQDAYNIYSAGYSSGYGGMLDSYQVSVSLVQNGTTTKSITL